MKIIKADITHLDTAAKLFDLYREFYNQASDLSGAKKFLQSRILNNESTIFLAFATNDEVAGFVQLYPSFSSVAMKKIMILNDLYVHEKYRGRGVGRELMKKAQEFAIEEKATKLTLVTAKDNEVGKKLYESEEYILDGFLKYFKNLK